MLIAQPWAVGNITFVLKAWMSMTFCFVLLSASHLFQLKEYEVNLV